MGDAADNKKTVTFHLIKSPNFESRRVDGAIGTLAPNGKVSLSFFVERGPIPKTVTHEIEEDGTLGPVKKKTGKEGVVREIQSGILLDIESLRDLCEQLTAMLTKFEEAKTPK